MRLTPEEVTRLAETLKGRNQLLIYLAALSRAQWWSTGDELATIARVPPRRAELELAELAELGYLDRKGAGRGSLATFRIRKNDQSDRSTQCVERSDRSFQNDQSDRSPHNDARARSRPTEEDPFRSSASGSASASASASASGDLDLHRPSVLGGPGGDGRTDGGTRWRLRAATEFVQERFGIDPKLSTPGLLRLLNAGATDHEIEAYALAYVRHSKGTPHRCFDGVEHAKFPFGAACTEERFATWRRSNKAREDAEANRRRVEAFETVEKQPPRSPKPVSAVSAREMEEFVRTQLRRR